MLDKFPGWCGSRTLEENVRRVFYKLLTNSLATKFYWMGKGWKRRFHDFES